MFLVESFLVSFWQLLTGHTAPTTETYRENVLCFPWAAAEGM